MQGKYKVITLCGSTRFKNAFMEAQKRLTLEGNIVISVGLFSHSEDNEVWNEMSSTMYSRTKGMLADMHKRKIDMADEIYVINVGGYIGDSTRSEISYAIEKGKTVRYLEYREEGVGSYTPIDVIPMSVRLRNVLTRNGMDYLYQVEEHCKEQLLKLRNMGLSTYQELVTICESYGIHIHSRWDLNDEILGVFFEPSSYEAIFEKGIRDKSDLINISGTELSKLFSRHNVTYKKLMRIKEACEGSIG